MNAARAQHDNEEDKEIVLMVSEQVSAVTDESDQWYLDLGATCHVTCCRELLHNYQPCRSKVNLVLGDDFKCQVEGMGAI